MSKSTTTVKKPASPWAKDNASVRVIPSQLSPQDQTTVDQLRSANIPKAIKEDAIAAIQAKAGAIPVHLVRHDDVSVEPLFCLQAPGSAQACKGIKASVVLAICDNHEFIRAYLDEMTS